MRNKKIAVLVLVVILGIAVSAAQAGEKCSLQTMTGTYAFYERGSSMVLDLDPAHQTIPVHWNGAIAPFVTVGEVTFTPDGVGEGFYWILTGSLSGGADPIPVQVTIFEMNPDCTGKFRYWITLPNAPQPTLVEERFFAFDNGSEYRSVPSLIGATGIPTLAWTGTGHRIKKSDDPPHSCGPQTAKGAYVETVENIVNFGPAVFNVTGFADALFIREDIAMNGQYTGTLFEKLGPFSIDQLPVHGKFVVNANCSFSGTLKFTIETGPVTIVVKGVFFDEGKEFFGLAIDPGVPYSFAQGKRIGQWDDR